MRIILGILALLSFLSPRAQTHLPVSSMYYSDWRPFPGYSSPSDSSHLNRKWYFSKYAGISAGLGFYSGGSATFLSAPVGLQLNRQLNNNVIAFAGVSAAPAFFSFNHSFSDPALYKSYPGNYLPNTYGFGMHARAEMGLMYVNDAKTFSISGSIGVERSSYPFYPAERTSTKKR